MTRRERSQFRISNCGLRIEETACRKSAIRHPKSAIGGFTLAEVLVASTISGFIAVIAVGALNAIASSSQRVNEVTETTSEIRFAARMLARDLANLYRDANPQNMKLIGAAEGNAKGGPPFLTFYTVGRAKARANQPEGDVYEVEYFLGTRQQQQKDETTEASEESTVLFRRLWPNPDKNRDPGGVLTPIAENIGVFQVRFYDGKQWGDEWTEEMQALPEYVEVTLATLPERGDPVVETFTVTFPRLSQTVPTAARQGTAGSQGEQGQQGTKTPATTGSSSGPAGSPAPQSSAGSR
jgi:general secretion pathway protein J